MADDSKGGSTDETETTGDNGAMTEINDEVVPPPSVTSQSDAPLEGQEDSSQMEVITEGVSKITPAEVRNGFETMYSLRT